MKYKVGDKAKVRSDLKVGQRYGADLFASGMDGFRGKTVTIERVCGNTYAIEEYGYGWTDEMLEKIGKEENKLKAYELMAKAAAEPEKYEGKKYEVNYGAYGCDGSMVQEFYISSDGDFRSSKTGYRTFIGLDTEVEEIPQSVPFMEAAKANDNGNSIRCEWDGEVYRYTGYRMIDHRGDAVCPGEILHGTWYIE